MADELEKRVSNLEAKIEGIARLEVKMDKLIDAMNKVLLLEQSQTTHSSALERAFGELEAMQNESNRRREVDETTHKGYDDIISRAKGAWFIGSILWGAFGAILLAGLVGTVREVIDLRIRVQIMERVQSDHLREVKEAGLIVNKEK